MAKNDDIKIEYVVNTKYDDYYKIPIFYNNVYSIELFNDNYDDINIDDLTKVLMVMIIRFSDIFEFKYCDKDRKNIILSVKEDVKYLDDELFNNVLTKLKSIEPRYFSSICERYSVKEGYVLNQIRNNSKMKKVIENILVYLINSNYKVNQDKLSYSNSSYLAYFLCQWCNDLDDCHNVDTKRLVDSYLKSLFLINHKITVFVKFANKKYINLDILKEKMITAYNELVIRLGKNKIDEIITEFSSYEAYTDELVEEIIDRNLNKKKSIDDEIDDINRQKEKILTTDPLYRQLCQRLDKLLLYKNHFSASQVINGEGIFEGYYGFEFDNIYVFDYFIDSDDDVKDKAKNESGNAAYILSYDDYLKVKDLRNKKEAKHYINAFLKPCADTVNHNSKFDCNLMSKLLNVKSNVYKRQLLMDLFGTDNPVTDEEIILTQDELNYFITKFLSNDMEKLYKVYETTKDKKLRKAIEKVIGVDKVEKEINSEDTIDELSNKDKERINKDINNIYKYLDLVNIERKQSGLEPLSINDDPFIEIYLAISEYKKKNGIVEKYVRDPLVALKTKERAFHSGGYYCELCGEASMEPIFVESHHFIPISEGGPDNIYNTVCLCTRCHTAIHNGRVTDEQKYRLIDTIRLHIEYEDPELLPKFETTLGFKDNYYLTKIDLVKKRTDDINNQMLSIIDGDDSDEVKEKELGELQQEEDRLKSSLDHLYINANKIQDYYRYSLDYEKIEEKIGKTPKSL